MVKLTKTFIICLLVYSLMPVMEVFAAPDLYDSTFQIGTTLYTQGNQVDYALRILKNSSFDWVALEVDWAQIQPDSQFYPNFEALKYSYQSLQPTNQNIFIRLVNPPKWSMTNSGPDINTVLTIIGQMLAELPSIQAMEVFPGANTSVYWGTNPSAEQYFNLLKSISAFFTENNYPVDIVAGGLIQVPNESSTTTIPDTDYLQQLYTLGLRDIPVIISIQFESINTNPEVLASDPSQITLRHYEQIRQVMINNQDHERQIWVTKLQPPDFTDNEDPTNAQVIWLQNAITQIRSQLYIQLCILQPINTNSLNNSSLILPEGELNPIIELFPFYALKLNNVGILTLSKTEKQILKLEKSR